MGLETDLGLLTECLLCKTLMDLRDLLGIHAQDLTQLAKSYKFGVVPLSNDLSAHRHASTLTRKAIDQVGSV